jgi:ribonuclease-3
MNFHEQVDTLDEQTQMLALCERRIGYMFRDRNQLREALTHASGAAHRLASNERMEFLGDAILGKVVCKHLFLKYPQYLEGDLTKIKSIVVSRQTCAKISQRLGLQEFLIVGKGMASCPTTPSSLMADVFESLIAAIELDGGPDEAEKFIQRHVIPEIEMAVAGEIEGNYKSLLQQYAQRVLAATPAYHLVQEKGPDHSKSFKVAALIAGELYPPAWGKNKKEAEQRAARNALSELRANTALPRSNIPVAAGASQTVDLDPTVASSNPIPDAEVAAHAQAIIEDESPTTCPDVNEMQSVLGNEARVSQLVDAVWPACVTGDTPESRKTSQS